MRKNEIKNCDGDPYLTRWHLFSSKWFTVMLHKFHRSDEDRALHDHPWSFISIMLWRGYYEHFEHNIYCSSCAGTGLADSGNEVCHPIVKCDNCEGTGIFHSLPRCKRKWPGMIFFRRAEWKHRVRLVDKKPAWTLVIHFRRRREWGYHMEDGWIHHANWWRQNCE